MKRGGIGSEAVGHIFQPLGWGPIRSFGRTAREAFRDTLCEMLP
jgi:hypothetical protein